LHPIYPFEQELASELALQGTGVGASAHLLNELVERRQHHRPYVLFGDPSGQDIAVVKVDEEFEIQTTASRAVVFSFPFDTELMLARTEPGDNGCLIATGRGVGLVLRQIDGVSVKIRNAYPEWHEMRTQLSTLAQRLPQAVRMEHGINRLYTTLLQDDSVAANHAEQLTSARFGLEAALQAAFAVSEEVRRSSLWDAKLNAASELAVLSAGVWDRIFAELAQLLVFSLSIGMENVATDSLELVTAEFVSRCDKCGRKLLASQFRDSISVASGPLSRDCGTCGFRSCSINTGVEVSCKVKGDFRRESNVAFEITAHDGGVSERWLARLPIWVLTQVKEKGSGRLLVDSLGTQEAGTTGYPVTVPADTRSDSHACYVVAVHALSVAFSRFRIDTVAVVD
jgi:hypothetical protein